MTSTAPTESSTWLRSSARDWIGTGVVLAFTGLFGFGVTVGAVVNLWTGGVRGGRLAGAALLVYATALVSVMGLLGSRHSKMWHVVVAVALLVPSGWIDDWLVRPDPRLSVPVLSLALASALLVHWARWKRRTRTRPTATRT